MTGLERRYRRLLYAFPGYYRRQRADEMLTTLLDGAAPGQVRPTPRETAGLLVAGLRCRLRLRRGPLTKLAAIVALFVGGVLTGTLGAWLGWQPAAPLPDSARAAAIARIAVPVTPDAARRDDFVFRPTSQDYQVGTITFSYATSAGRGPSPLVVAARQRLRAAGWSVSRWHHTPGGYTTLVAYSGDVQLTVEDGWGPAEVRIARAQPAAAPLLAIGGVLVGGLTGWLLAGGVSRRIARAHPARQAAAIIGSAVALTALAPAAVYCLVPVIRGYVEQGQMEPPWISLSLPGLAPLTALGMVVGLVVVGLSTVPRPNMTGRILNGR